MPLSLVSIGDEVIIHHISCSGTLKKRLESMGLIPGTKLTILSNNTNGSFLVLVRGSKLVLGSSVTNKIIVQIF